MRKPAATTLLTPRAEDRDAPRLDLQLPSAAPPPTALRAPRPADRIKEALLRWLEEEL